MRFPEETVTLIALLVAFLLLPVAGFLIRGWRTRRDEIAGALTDKGINCYTTVRLKVE